jgi:hypothetical protein
MSGKPRLLLLDAGAVFAALRFDAWEALVAAYEVIVPSVVVRVEAIFYVNLQEERSQLGLTGCCIWWLGVRAELDRCRSVVATVQDL